jgi:hypothetical protein
MFRALARLLAPRPPARRTAFGRFVPGLTPLEGRDVPAALPFHQTLTFAGLDPSGGAIYTGQATHLGKTTTVIDAENNFVKTAANGDTLVGVLKKVTDATGEITYTGGTGQLYGTTGQSTYVIGPDGVVTVTGTLDNGKTAGAAASTFKTSGSGLAPSGLPLYPKGNSGPHTIDSGVATGLGRLTGSGTFQVGDLSINATGKVTGTFQGSFVFEAANGDRLAFTYGDGYSGVLTGQLTADGQAVVGVKFDAIFTYDAANSTGRFANLAGGSLRMLAQADEPIRLTYSLDPDGNPVLNPNSQPFTYSWVGEGTLEKTTGKK